MAIVLFKILEIVSLCFCYCNLDLKLELNKGYECYKCVQNAFRFNFQGLRHARR